ncbi:MAG TPA: RNA polymerase sigma factor [Thermoleophilaceae bacterium]|nr:RNA polymerase sigma factor [Thermoleophilaceae bacterium]
MSRREEEFERLYEEHAPGLLAFLAYRTGDRALAEDLLADTFERVLRARRRFDPRRASAKTWVYSIALNLLRDQARRRDAEGRALGRAHAVVPFEGPSALDRIAGRDELMRGLAGLSEEEREALALRYGADLTLPEIAELSGEKLTTVEGRVYRGLRKLREVLEG